MNVKTTILRLTIVATGFVSRHGFAQEVDSLLKASLKTLAYPIESCELLSKQDDIEFMRSIANNRRIISVGEATHGTREFAQIKGKLFKFLVETAGFNAIALEVDFGEAMGVNEYVLGLTNDGLTEFKRLKFFHCVNEETWQLIEWIRSYNAGKSQGQQVKFYGVDIQMTEGQMRQIEHFFSRVDPDFTNFLRIIRPIPASGYYGPYISMEDIQMIRAKLRADSTKQISKSNLYEWSSVLHLTYTLEYYYNLRTDPQNADFTRDLAMKKNVDWILCNEGEQSRIFLWAHNEHVMYDSVYDQQKGGHFKSMGYLCRESYGSEIYTIGLDFNRGKFYANKPLIAPKKVLTVYEIDDAPPTLVESGLSKGHFERFFIDLSKAPREGRLSELLNEKVLMRSIGGMIPEICIVEQTCGFRPVVLTRAFDGLIFINQTNEVKLLNE